MKKYHYRNIKNMIETINKNLRLLPNDFDLIVGVPRSGMIPAYTIALFLNKRVCSLDEFLNNNIPSKGERPIKGGTNIKKVLIVDDSINTGRANKILLDKIKERNIVDIEIRTLVIYGTDNSKNRVDYCFEIVGTPRVFEWNYLNHTHSSNWCFDIDGVLCVDPTPEQNDDGPRYVDFILNAKPLHIPNYKIYALVTSRLEKYRKETEIWLKNNGVQYEHLFMLDLPSKEERQRLKAHSSFKATVYNHLSKATMFIESETKQAKEISLLTGKPCISVEDNFMYQEELSMDQKVIRVLPDVFLGKVEDVKVSVIMPVYNVAKFIQQSLDTIRSQSLKDIEIICVDDGSTDNTYNILLENSKSDKRIKLIKQKNMQAGVARNTGLNEASGKYVIFLDPDDFYCLDMLEKAYKKIEECSADICVFQAAYFDNETGDLKHFPPELLRKNELPDKEVFSYKDIKNNIFTFTNGAPWNKIYRKDFLDKNCVRFQDLRNTNDAYFTFISLAKAEKITCLYEELMYYRRNVTTSLQSTKEMFPVEFAKAFKSIQQELMKIGIYDDVKESFNNRALLSTFYNLESTKGYEAFRIIFNLIKNDLISQFNLLDVKLKPYCKTAYAQIAEIRRLSIEEYWEIYQKNLLRNLSVNKKGKDKLKREIEEIKNSYSYLIGRCITYIPRKFRGAIRCCKQYGFMYTLKRIGQKVKWLFDKGCVALICLRQYGIVFTFQKIKDTFKQKI